jgi:hypothetical protein
MPCASQNAVNNNFPTTCLVHPQFSLDLMPSDLHFFGSLKKHLKEKCFWYDGWMKGEVYQ